MHTGSIHSVPLKLVFPSTELRDQATRKKMLKDVTWLPTPLPGRSIEVAFTFTSSRIDKGEEPGSPTEVHLLAKWLLPNGETVWITWTDLPTTDRIEGLIRVQRARANTTPPIRFKLPDNAPTRFDRIVIGGPDVPSMRMLIDASRD